MIERETLDNNIKLHKEYNEILKTILSKNDKALVSNLLDFSKKIIIDVYSLEHLIKTAINNDETLTLNITEIPRGKKCNCCGKCSFRMSLFNDIQSIVLNDKRLETCEPELYQYLTEVFNISLSKTYINNLSEMVKITKDE